MLKKILWCFLFCAAIWTAGFVWFVNEIPLESPARLPSADAVVVLTGGRGRLAYGLELLSEGKGKKLFITGVNNGVTLNALLHSAQADISVPLPEVPPESIILDYQARNTIGNAAQAVEWLNSQHYRSILLVTTNYHLPRSLIEFREIAPDITVYPAPVFSSEFILDGWQTDKNTRMLLLIEYHKFLAATLRHWLLGTAPHMTALRSLLFNICFTAWGIIAPIIFSPLALPSFKTAIWSGRVWARVSLWLVTHICGVREEIRGSQYITVSPVIYACKHQSAWDTLSLFMLLKRPAYVLKRELIFIPFWGWYLWRMKMIAIDRAKGMASLRQITAQARQALVDGRPIVIYPEGTRTPPGATPRYHSGIAALYAELNVPVVPVALNSGLRWGRNAFLKRPGTIIMEFLPPIAPGLPKQEFMTRLKDTIETASQRLLEDSINPVRRASGCTGSGDPAQLLRNSQDL